MDTGAEGDVASGAAADIEAFGVVPFARIAVGRGKEQQYLRVRGDSEPADIDRPGGCTEERLYGRLPTQDLIKSLPRQRRVVPQRLPLSRIGGECVERISDTDDRGVEPGGEKGAHEQGRLFCRDLAGVDSGPDRRADAVRRKRLAGTLRIDIGDNLRYLGHGGLEMRIARAEGVEHHGAVGQQVFETARSEADGIWKHAQRISL